MNPIAAEVGKVHGRVKMDGVFLHSGQDLETQSLVGFMAGNVVEVLERNNATEQIGEFEDYWYRVRTPNGLSGWVFGKYLDLFVQLEYRGVSLIVEEGVAGGASAGYVDASIDRDDKRWPGHIKITIDDYLIPRVSEVSRCILVYPLEGGLFGDTADRLEIAIGELGAGGNTDDTIEIPVVPLPTGAHQAFVAGQRVIENRNVRGIRFLTRYVQDLVWPPPEMITYTYQGYTRDRSAWVSASFLVRRPPVAADNTERPEAHGIWDGYAGFAEELSAQPGNAFYPTLGALDELIRSMSVSW